MIKIKLLISKYKINKFILFVIFCQVQLKEGEKQLTLWQKRLNVLKKLKAGFDSAGCPHAPVEVLASVTGSNNIHIKV